MEVLWIAPLVFEPIFFSNWRLVWHGNRYGLGEARFAMFLRGWFCRPSLMCSGDLVVLHSPSPSNSLFFFMFGLYLQFLLVLSLLNSSAFPHFYVSHCIKLRLPGPPLLCLSFLGMHTTFYFIHTFSYFSFPFFLERWKSELCNALPVFNSVIVPFCDGLPVCQLALLS